MRACVRACVRVCAVVPCDDAWDRGGPGASASFVALGEMFADMDKAFLPPDEAEKSAAAGWVCVGCMCVCRAQVDRVRVACVVADAAVSEDRNVAGVTAYFRCAHAHARIAATTPQRCLTTSDSGGTQWHFIDASGVTQVRCGLIRMVVGA